jgi:hypothetical protein
MATQRSRKTKRTSTSPEEELLRLYEPYRFLEKDHWGEFLVVSSKGGYVTGSDEIAAVDEALARFGPDLTILKVGEIAAGRIPWLKAQ